MHLLEELDGRIVDLPALPWRQSECNVPIDLIFFFHSDGKQGRLVGAFLLVTRQQHVM